MTMKQGSLALADQDKGPHEGGKEHSFQKEAEVTSKRQ